MDKKKDSDRENFSSGWQTFVNLIFYNPLISAILAIIVGLFIQYKTPLFQSTSESDLNTSISSLGLFLITVATIAFLFSLNNVRYILFNPKRYFREEFALALSSVIFWLAIICLVSVHAKLMPWHVFIIFFQHLAGQEVSPVVIHWSELAFIFLLLILAYVIASSLHSQWNGRKSTQQYNRDQENEPDFFLSEGIREFLRICRREPSLEEYLEPGLAQLETPLETAIDPISKAWKDQACELLRLSSSSYIFDLDLDWHDKEGCWIGKDIHSNKLVFLYPVDSQPSNNDIKQCNEYPRNCARDRNQEIGEIVIAVKEEEVKLETKKRYKQIRFETENSLLENLVNFADYRNYIRKQIEVNLLPESNWTLQDVYVPSQFKGKNDERSEESLEDYLLKWLNEPSKRQIALLGDYGQGKSSAALMFTYNLLFNKEKAHHRIPIPIELRGTSPRNLSPLELLGAWTSQYRIDSQALMRLHIAGRLLLIFEGFDEMALSGNPEARLKHFKTLWKFCYPQAKILITGRPNLFLDDVEMKAALGIHQPTGDNPYCQAIRLAPFSVEQIGQSLRKQKPDTQNQIVSLAGENPRFLELVSRPSLLHVVSLLWEEEKLGEQIDRLTSAFVMERFVKNSYRRQGLKAEKGSKDFMALNSSEREYFMEGIASYMAAKELKNQISREELNQLVKDLIEAIPDSVSIYTTTMAGEDNRPLRQRIQDPKEEDIEHIQTDVRTCGLLVSDPSAPGKFKFGHKSFMEYLFAATVAEYIKDENLEKSRAIFKVTGVQLEALLKLPVSLEFLSELIGTNIDITDNDNSSATMASKLKGKRAVARKVFYKIFNVKNNKLSKFIFYFYLFNHVYSKSRIRFHTEILHYYQQVKKNIYQKAKTRVNSLFFGKKSSLSQVEYLSPIKYVSFFLLVDLIFSLLHRFITFQDILGLNELKLSLCNKICHHLGIEDRILHEFAGTLIFPWVKHQKFNYWNLDDKTTRQS